jgi:hypothetical protein
VFVSPTGAEQDARWLPKSQIERGEVRDDGRVTITMPRWLAKERGLGPRQVEIPF